jgi:molybdopterin-guanine dinucleotide biosynthesis protein A
VIAPRDITLGILAGGRGTRLGGCGKAWIVRDGVTQVERIARRFAKETHEVLVSANADAARFEALGFRVVADRVPDLGPIAGLDALANACRTPWLLTIPVDLVSVNDCLLPTLASAGGQGASVEDDDGVQPLVALWSVGALRPVLDSRLRGNDDLSVQGLQDALAMPRIRLSGVRFGNLNTRDDLAAAGAILP